MIDLNNFPAQIHIDRIRSRLWTGREFGQAAVMVGSGFSRNAEQRSPNVSRFPLWPDIAGLMYDSLYLPEKLQSQDRERDKLKATSGGGVLRLASEYETVFGRSALDELLLKAIPDNDYTPGKLHELLLSLPWSDVFTTNYDTLLERTLPAIYERKYDVVSTVSDIPGRMRPRIVKLHGSFPSQRRFLITEEDYRKYPKDVAPFVNIVQQSLMENVFCLVGFSGDDPNFLYWSGWVRDNLGEATPSIYLVGILGLSGSRIRLFESRRIIPIDLSPLFPLSAWTDSELRHRKAIEWFLCTLMNGEPPRVMDWPTPSHGNIRKPCDDLRLIPPRSSQLSDLGEIQPNSASIQPEDLKRLVEVWRQKRLEFPGWVVAPTANREVLWRYTERWIEPILDSITTVPPPHNLSLLYELNWRLETALLPLFMNWVEKMVPVVESFNPYPGLVTFDVASVRSDKDEYNQFEWKSIGEYWVQLAFAVVREAREDQDENRFRLWMTRLENVVKQRLEWQARWFHEECLFYLLRFDQERVRKTLDAWPSMPAFPFWEAKRASILAELGELKEAETIAESALTGIRSRLQPFSSDYNLLSQEGWVMVLLQAIKFEWNANRDFAAQYRDRWDKLATYRCNPWTEIEASRLVLNAPRPTPRPEKELKKDFDPGRVTVTRHFFSGSGISDFQPAFAFLRMLEEGGLPLKCGMIDMFSEIVVHAAEWIKPYAPLWVLGSVLRTGKDTALKEWFDRVYVATMSQSEIDHINLLLTNALSQGIRHSTASTQEILEGTSFAFRQITIASELLSRLCFRFTSEQLDQLFDTAIEMYKLPIFRQSHLLHDCVKVIFERLMYAIPHPQLLNRLDELLGLPIPTEAGFDVSFPERWREPFNFIQWPGSLVLNKTFDRSGWSISITNLIRIAKNGTQIARERAVLRLAVLHHIHGLSAEEESAFGDALWSSVDPATNLPINTGLLDSSFLSLPQPEKGEAKKRFRQLLLARDFPRTVHHSIAPDGHKSKSVGNMQANRYIREWLEGTIRLFPKDENENQRYVDWTGAEIGHVLKKASVWWDEEKEELKSKGVFADEVREQYLMLIKLMGEVFLPRLASADSETKALAIRVLSEVEQLGLCTLSALPMVLFISPDLYDEIAEKLRDGLNAMNDECVQESIKGLYYWLVYGERGSIANPPGDLLNEVVSRAVARRQPGLASVLGNLSVLVKHLPELFDANQVQSLCTALEYLIKETELPNQQDRDRISALSTMIPVDERPEYRKLAAHLAYSLFIGFSKKSLEIPTILTRWEEVCQNDPLPEVKRAWL